MHKRFDPFEGMTPAERAQAIFKQNKSYDDDIVDLIKFIGGKDNIKSVRYATQEDLEKLTAYDATSNFLVVDVKNIRNTDFYCDVCEQKCLGQCKCCSLRTFNAYIDCFRLDSDVFIEYKEPMKYFMDCWVDFYKAIDVNKVDETLQVADKLNKAKK